MCAAFEAGYDINAWCRRSEQQLDTLFTASDNVTSPKVAEARAKVAGAEIHRSSHPCGQSLLVVFTCCRQGAHV